LVKKLTKSEDYSENHQSSKSEKSEETYSCKFFEID